MDFGYTCPSCNAPVKQIKTSDMGRKLMERDGITPHKCKKENRK